MMPKALPEHNEYMKSGYASTYKSTAGTQDAVDPTRLAEVTENLQREDVALARRGAADATPRSPWHRHSRRATARTLPLDPPPQ